MEGIVKIVNKMSEYSVKQNPHPKRKRSCDTHERNKDRDKSGRENHNNPETGKEEDESEENNCKSNLMFAALALVIIVVVYFGLFLIISHTRPSQQLRNEMIKQSIGPDNTSCGANSFMLRDLVCDETTNTEICLYDGGDCCLEIKDTKLCHNCSCILLIDSEILLEQFADSETKPFKDPDMVELAIEKWIVMVLDVVSRQVCAKLCLDHDKQDQINAWHYLESLQICKCGWIESTPCPEHLVTLDWNLTEISDLTHNVYLQMEKTIPCECLTTDLLIEGTRTKKDLKELSGKEVLLTSSALHCQKKCLLDDGCTFISWQRPSGNSNAGGGECRLMESLTANNQSSILLMDSTVSFTPGWISTARGCQSFHEHFSSYANSDNSFRIACPVIGESNGTALLSQSDDFLVTVNILPDSDSHIEVIRMKDDKSLRCAHSLFPPKVVKDATGGVLIQPTSGDIAIIVCGGSTTKKANEIASYGFCQSVGDYYKNFSAQLRLPRRDAASLVVDNGASLFLTGGNHVQDASGTTEYVGLVSDKSGLVNGIEKSLPDPRHQHCLTKVGKEVAILAGGQTIMDTESGRTWTLNVNTMSWREQLPLQIGRSKHVCGSIKDQTLAKLIVIAAGGQVLGGNLTTSVEMLVGDSEEQFHNSFLGWEPGPEMPLNLTEASSVTTADKTKMLVIGGKTNIDLSSSIFQIQCQDLQCQWTKLDYNLFAPTSNGLAFMLPSIPMVSRLQIDSQCQIYSKTRVDDIVVFASGMADWEEIDYSEGFVLPNNQGLRPCSSSEIHSPYKASKTTGGVLNLKHSEAVPPVPTPVICGGVTNIGQVVKECFRLGHDLPLGRLVVDRFRSASIVTGNGSTLWITGGYSYHKGYEDSTEWIQVSEDHLSLTASEGVKLPEALADHCLVKIDERLALLYGGESMDIITGHTWTIDLGNLTGGWTQLTSLTTPRSGHICGVVRDASSKFLKVVVAAGGDLRKDVNDPTNNVELYQINHHDNDNREWIAGPTLPYKLRSAASATTQDQTVLIVAGGRLVDLLYIGRILLFQCSDMICEWKLHCLALKIARRNFVAFSLPPPGLTQPTGGRITNITVLGQCETIEQEPAIDEECLPAWIGDHICDGINNKALCLFDGGDCDQNLNGTCGDVGGDGHCDGIWNIPGCAYDGGDCCLPVSRCGSCLEYDCKCHVTGKDHCIVGLCKHEGDGECDGEHNVPECHFDRGDCCLESADCRRCEGDACLCHSTGMSHCACDYYDDDGRNMTGDGICHGQNNIEACKYDGGDCCDGLDYNCWYCTDWNCDCHETGTDLCGGTCQYGGDLDCDGGNNVASCNYDDGDCCLETTVCDWCEGSDCKCHETGLTHCFGMVTCNDQMSGDDVCNMQNNHAECGYDGGDCCSGQDKDCYACYGIGCICHSTGTVMCPGTCQWGNDGKCDGQNNVATCNYDDGDCCLEETVCTYCDGDECTCHETGVAHCPVWCPQELHPEWIGDGVCEDFLNIAECEYDGGDCCLPEVVTDYCLDCECLP